MASVWIVEGFDVVEDGEASLIASGEAIRRLQAP